MSANLLVYIIAFKYGDKVLAQGLFDRRNLSDVGSKLTTFPSLLHNKQVGNVSLLHLAAYWGWNDFAELLVTSYSDAIKDGEGHIPLHYAAYNGHLDLVRYLIIARGCDPFAENNYKMTPLHLACGNVNSTSSGTSSEISPERHTVTHRARMIMVIHLFTMLVVMVTLKLSGTSLEGYTVTHHVRTLLVIHHFIMLVLMVTSILFSTSSARHTVTHHV